MKQQLEFHLDRPTPVSLRQSRFGRSTRARWWFKQMRQAVDLALDPPQRGCVPYAQGWEEPPLWPLEIKGSSH